MCLPPYLPLGTLEPCLPPCLSPCLFCILIVSHPVSHCVSNCTSSSTLSPSFISYVSPSLFSTLFQSLGAEGGIWTSPVSPWAGSLEPWNLSQFSPRCPPTVFHLSPAVSQMWSPSCLPDVSHRLQIVSGIFFHNSQLSSRLGLPIVSKCLPLVTQLFPIVAHLSPTSCLPDLAHRLFPNPLLFPNCL